MFGLQFHILSISVTIIVLQIVLVPFLSALSQIAQDGWLDWVRISHIICLGVRGATDFILQYTLPVALFASLSPAFWVHMQLHSVRFAASAPYFVASIRWIWAVVCASASGAALQALISSTSSPGCSCASALNASSWSFSDLLQWQGVLTGRNSSTAWTAPHGAQACPAAQCEEEEGSPSVLSSVVPVLAIGVTVSAAFGVSSWLHSTAAAVQAWAVPARLSVLTAAHKRLQAAKSRLQRSVSILLSNSRETGRAFASQSMQTVQSVRNRQAFLAWLPASSAPGAECHPDIGIAEDLESWESDESSVSAASSGRTEMPQTHTPTMPTAPNSRKCVIFEASALESAVFPVRATSPLLRTRHRWSRSVPQATPATGTPLNWTSQSSSGNHGTSLITMAEDVLNAAKVVDDEWWMAPIRYVAEIGSSPLSGLESEASWNTAVPVLLKPDTKRRIEESVNIILGRIAALRSSPRKRKRSLRVADVSGGVLSPFSMFSADSAPKPRQAKRLRLESTPPRHRQRRALARTPQSALGESHEAGRHAGAWRSNTPNRQGIRASLFGTRATPGAPGFTTPQTQAALYSPAQGSVALSDTASTVLAGAAFSEATWASYTPRRQQLFRQSSHGVNTGPRARLWGADTLDLGSGRLSHTAPRASLSPGGRLGGLLQPGSGAPGGSADPGHQLTQQQPRPRSFSANDVIALFSDFTPLSPAGGYGEQTPLQHGLNPMTPVHVGHQSEVRGRPTCLSGAIAGEAPPTTRQAAAHAPAAQRHMASNHEAEAMLLVWPQLAEQRSELQEVCAWHEAHGGLSLLPSAVATHAGEGENDAETSGQMAQSLLPLALKNRLLVMESALQTQSAARAALRLLSVAPVAAGHPMRAALATAHQDTDEAVRMLRGLSEGRLLPLVRTVVSLLAVFLVLLLVVEGAATRLLGDTHAVFAFLTLQESTSWSRTPSIMLGIASLAGSAAVVAVEFLRMAAFLAAAVTGFVAPWPAVHEASRTVLLTTPIHWISSSFASLWFALTHIGQQIVRRSASHRTSGIGDSSSRQEPKVQGQHSEDRLLQLQMTYQAAANASRAGRLQQLLVLGVFAALLLASAAPFTAVSLGMGSPGLLTLMYGGADEMSSILEGSDEPLHTQAETGHSQTYSSALAVRATGQLQPLAAQFSDAQNQADPLSDLFSYEGLWNAIVDNGWDDLVEVDDGATGSDESTPLESLPRTFSAGGDVIQQTTPQQSMNVFPAAYSARGAIPKPHETYGLGKKRATQVAPEAAIDVFFASSVRRALSTALAILFLVLCFVQIVGQNIHPLMCRVFENHAAVLAVFVNRRSRVGTL